MELSKTASAFGLHSYKRPAPEGGAFKQFHTSAIAQFDKYGIAATFVGIEGGVYSGEYERFGGTAHQKVMQSGFDRITSLSIVANPEDSDAPSYDGYATASLSFVESTREALLCFVANESFIRFGGDAYDDAWKAFLDLMAWDSGYGFRAETEGQPEFHVLGLDNGNLDQGEHAALNAWYAALPDERLDRIRDVYAYNFVSTRQLDNKETDDTTLRQLIARNQLGQVEQLTDYDLHLWKLDEGQIGKARGLLGKRGWLISR